MTVRRFFWIVVSPLVYIAYWLWIISYKWVNICFGATSPGSFDELWQYEHYGTRCRSIPEQVNLNGIMHSAQVLDDDKVTEIVFRDAYGISGSTIKFRRNKSDRMWFLSVYGLVCASHVEKAYRWVLMAYGGPFERLE